VGGRIMLAGAGECNGGVIDGKLPEKERKGWRHRQRATHVPDMGRRVLEHEHGLLQLQGRNVEAPSNVLGHAQGHVGPGEAGEEAPHLEDSDGAAPKDLACEVVALKGLGVHLGEGLGVERGGGGRGGKGEKGR